MDFGMKFKTSLFGFSKKDVISCIQELNESHQQELEEVRLEVAAAQKKYDELQEISAETSRMLSDSEQQCEQYQKKNQALESVVKRLVEERKDGETEITRLRQASLTNSSRISELQFSNHELQRKLDEAEDKLDKYNELCENISDVMLDAQKISTQLQQDAERQAKRIVDEAQRSVEQIGSDARRYHSELDQISQSLNDVIAQLQKRLEEMEKSFSESGSSVEDERETVPVPEKKPVKRVASGHSSAANDFLGKVKEWLK